MARLDLEEVLRLKRTGDLDGALISLEGMLGVHPHPIVLAQLADIQLRRGRLDEAEAALDRAEAGAGTTAETARLRGDLDFRTGRLVEAARCYEDATALGDRRTWTLVQLGRARMQLGDLVGARGAAAQAVERDDGASTAWVLLGDIERRQGRLEEAESMYAKAHARSPGDEWAYAKLIEVRLLRLPPDRRAREVSVLRKSGGSNNRHLTAVLAKLRSEEGDEVAAATAWRERVELTGDLFSRKQYGYALRRAEQFDEAASVLGSCLLDDPRDIILFKTYVRLQRQRHALDELRRTLEAALPRSGGRRGNFYGELSKLPAPATVDAAGGTGAAEAAGGNPTLGVGAGSTRRADRSRPS